MEARQRYTYVAASRFHTSKRPAMVVADGWHQRSCRRLTAAIKYLLVYVSLICLIQQYLLVALMTHRETFHVAYSRPARAAGPCLRRIIFGTIYQV